MTKPHSSRKAGDVRPSARIQRFSPDVHSARLALAREYLQGMLPALGESRIEGLAEAASAFERVLALEDLDPGRILVAAASFWNTFTEGWQDHPVLADTEANRAFEFFEVLAQYSNDLEMNLQRILVRDAEFLVSMANMLGLDDPLKVESRVRGFDEGTLMALGVSLFLLGYGIYVEPIEVYLRTLKKTNEASSITQDQLLGAYQRFLAVEGLLPSKRFLGADLAALRDSLAHGQFVADNSGGIKAKLAHHGGPPIIAELPPMTLLIYGISMRPRFLLASLVPGVCYVQMLVTGSLAPEVERRCPNLVRAIQRRLEPELAEAILTRSR